MMQIARAGQMHCLISMYEESRRLRTKKQGDIVFLNENAEGQ